MAKHFPNFISKNVHSPKVFLYTINAVLNATVTAIPEPTAETCKEFLKFFIAKIDKIRSRISHSVHDPSDLPVWSAFLSKFEPVSLSNLMALILYSPTTCPLDLAPTLLLSNVLHVVAPTILPIINSGLASGSILSCY